MPVPHNLDYHCFVQSFGIGKRESTYFVLLKIVISVTGLLQLNMIFRISLHTSAKKTPGILIEGVLDQQINLGSIANLKILNLLIHDHGLIFHFFR